MAEVVSVKFKEGGRAYYFDPEQSTFTVGESVIVETSNGVSIGTISKTRHTVNDDAVVTPLKRIIRRADEKDMQRVKENGKKEEAAYKICNEKIAQHKLDMKLVSVEYSFDGSKITFFFTADGRVDFRELVKDLAAHFHARIELRQIGVRDEAKMLGGIAICGQPYCCKRFLDEFQPVTVKMAKEQGLSLNPPKISGSCGRLMCCLKYEQDSYEYLMKITPPLGATVKGPDGVGTVIDVNLITGNLIVNPKDEDGIPYKIHRSRVKTLSGGRKKQNDSDKEAENK